jgi:hypothetical protein
MIQYGYVDVRAIWPTYIVGFKAIKLEGKPRDITPQEAHEVSQKLGLL